MVMKFYQFCTYLRLNRVISCMVFLAFFALSGVEAQETYVQYANHLVGHPPSGVAFSAALEGKIFSRVNAFRRVAGRRPLEAEGSTLSLAAKAQAVDLLLQGRVGHLSSRGYDFSARMRAMSPGVLVLPAMGENAARSTRRNISDDNLADYIVGQWMQSPAHRKAMLSADFIAVGTGVARRGGDVYAVQIFVGPRVKSNFGLVQGTQEQGLY